MKETDQDRDPDKIPLTMHKDDRGAWFCQPYIWRNPVTGKYVRKLIRVACADDEKSAEKKARKEMRRIMEDGEPIDVAADGFLKYIKSKPAKTPANTVRSYTYSLKLIKEYFGKHDATVKHIGKQDIISFDEWLQGENGKSLSPASAANVHWCLSAMFEWLLKHEKVNENPVRKAGAPSLGRGRARRNVVVFTNPEQSRIMHWADHKLNDISAKAAERLEAIAVLLALETGLRVGEICALRVCDYEPSDEDDIHGKLMVCGTVVRGGRRSVIRQDKTKSGRDRIIELSPITRKHLDAWKRSIGKRNDGRALISIDGAWTNPDRISANFNRFCKKPLDLQQHSSFHTLRHTYATDVLKKSYGSLSDVSEILGHADQATTLRFYSASLVGNRKDIAERTGSFFEKRLNSNGGDNS